MTFAPTNSDQQFLPPNIDLPNPKEEPDLFYEVINERERNTASIVNSKQNGNYSTQEQLSCQFWFKVPTGSTEPLQRLGFRKVINFGALPNAGTKSVAHGITVTAATSITHIYGAATNPTATDPNPSFIPLPYVDVTTENNEITLYASNTKVYVITAADYTAFTICYIILDYLQN
jgi:hypothetical protein